MPVKLSEAQRELLRDAAKHSSVYVVEAYQPRRKLIEAGLLELVDGTDRLRITEAGRRALQEDRDG